MDLRRSRPEPAGERQPILLGTRAQRAAIAGLVVLSFGAGLGMDRLGGVTASSTLSEAQGYDTLEETWDLIQNEYVDIDGITEEELMQGAASGMVEALGDTGHSTYLTPEEAEAFNASTEGEFVGIGIYLDFETGRPVIVSALDNSPAEKAGLRTGDVITSIDGQSTDGMSQFQVSERLAGEEGEAVDLGISRPSDEDEFDVSIVRARVEIVPVTWRMLPDGVAHIRLSEFSVGATRELQAAIRSAESDGATSIIFDLRDNPGGLVFEAIGVASQFLPEGTPIYLNQEKDQEPLPIKAVPDGLATDIPLVVLINGGSASSSEITAAGISDSGRGELIGQTTFGTGTVLTPFELEDGSIVLLGTALWLEPDGDQVWRTGVEPDQDIALEAGSFISRPSDDPELTADELVGTGDAQLIAGYETLTGEVLAQG